MEMWRYRRSQWSDDLGGLS